MVTNILSLLFMFCREVVKYVLVCNCTVVAIISIVVKSFKIVTIVVTTLAMPVTPFNLS